jgi:Lantibiotic dehydratase, N terminus
MECIEELAPCVVVRGALFPLSILLGLTDAELTKFAESSDTLLTPAFEQAYEASMQRQRRTLSAATIGDSQFLRALCLTNDNLSRTIAKKGALPATPQNKEARRLNTTLYNYLARAVWRTEPCDLFAGITLAHWGSESRVASRPACYALSPDLRPYQFMVQTLAYTRPYVERGIYKLNPTLAFVAELQCWRYTVRVFGSIITREWPSSPGVDALLRALAELEPAPLSDIATRLRYHDVEHPALDRMLAALQRGGLLVGGLAFPRTFATAWDALMAIGRELHAEHARPWRSAVFRLRRLCRRIERTMETISLAELHKALDEARSIPATLAQALDVEAPQLPRSILRCDTGLPFSIVLGPEAKARLTNAVAEQDLFERYHGVDAAARAAHRKFMLQKPGPRASTLRSESESVPTQESAWLVAGEDGLLRERLERWSRWLKAETRDNMVRPGECGAEVKPAPVGGLIIRPRRFGYEIIGSTTEIGAAYGRYGQIWYSLAHRSRRHFEGHSLHEWYREVLTRVARSADVEIVEYVGPCEAMPNGLARPRFNFPMWDRWGTASSYRADQLDVDTSNAASIPLVSAAWCPRSISLTCFSPVNLGYSEPRLECLLLSSFREIPFWFASGLPMQCELALVRPSPPLALPSGNLVRLRRTWLHGSALAEFVAAERSRRFLLWQDLARRFSWPKLVRVALDGGRALPVVRDSPLAVEAAFQKLRKGVKVILIEDLDDHTWLRNEEGQGFAAEFIVPFLRRCHAWSELAASQSGSSSTP